jgi:hypothetical protein
MAPSAPCHDPSSVGHHPAEYEAAVATGDDCRDYRALLFIQLLHGLADGVAIATHRGVEIRTGDRIITFYRIEDGAVARQGTVGGMDRWSDQGAGSTR